MSTRKRKFKFQPGDEVRCIHKYEDELVDGSVVRDFTRNRTYIVTEVIELDHGMGDWLQFNEDNTGSQNGWNAKHFKLERRLKS